MRQQAFSRLDSMPLIFERLIQQTGEASRA